MSESEDTSDGISARDRITDMAGIEIEKGPEWDDADKEKDTEPNENEDEG